MGNHEKGDEVTTQAECELSDSHGYDPHAWYAEAKAREEHAVEHFRNLWAQAGNLDEGSQKAIKEVIDFAMDLVEDQVDLAAMGVAEAERAAGESAVPWKTVKAELGL